MPGPLSGYRIIEFAGIGPAPFAGMMFSDMGADVIRIDRAHGTAANGAGHPVVARGRRSIVVDLKCPEGIETVLRLVASADALIEGFRPGVMERLGLGPDVCTQRNERLVFGRMTGWGQRGPYAKTAGHDINYIALAGALAHFGRAGEVPVPPINLVGDFGGGGMLLAFGVVCALLEAQRSGHGQVVDAAMVDGTALLMTMCWGMSAQGTFDQNAPGTNLLDTGAPFYDVYRCADGKFVTFGSVEGQFYAEFLQRVGLSDDADFASQYDRTTWPQRKQRLTALFASKSQREWCDLLEYTDVCFAPVLTMDEASAHPHNVERGTFVEFDGVMQPTPAPRMSRTPGALAIPPANGGDHSREVLAELGLTDVEIDALFASGAVK